MAATPTTSTAWASTNVQRATHDGDGEANSAAALTDAKYLTLSTGTWYRIANTPGTRLLVRRDTGQSAVATLRVHRPGTTYDDIEITDRDYDAIPATGTAVPLLLGPFPLEFYGGTLYFRNGASAPGATNAFDVVVLTD